MPIYDYACACGARFEALLAGFDAPAPSCPGCGGAPSRRPSAASLLGGARPPAGPERAPNSWNGTYQGNSEYIASWRRRLDERAGLEARYPELAVERSPVVAHEGPYHAAPLTAAELGRGTIIPPGYGHGHAHPHPHPHPHTGVAGRAAPPSRDQAKGPAPATPASGASGASEGRAASA